MVTTADPRYHGQYCQHHRPYTSILGVVTVLLVPLQNGLHTVPTSLIHYGVIQRFISHVLLASEAGTISCHFNLSEGEWALSYKWGRVPIQ